MKKQLFYFIKILAVIIVVHDKSNAQANFSLADACEKLTHLYGKQNDSSYLYATAGDRLYAIGNQAGNFPKVGFHVQGEMGGIWQQPIKLLDGFRLSLYENKTKQLYALNSCDSFITYPFTTSFQYTFSSLQLAVARTQFIPDGKPVLVVEYAFKNNSTKNKDYVIRFYADINLSPVWLGERTGMIDYSDSITSFKNNMLKAKDEKNTWYAVVACDKNAKYIEAKKSGYNNNGATGELEINIHIESGKTALLHFYFSGSMNNANEAEENIISVKNNLAFLFNQKDKRYKQLAENASINIPDTAIMQAYNWGKYSTDWLTREVPGLGRGLNAGLPDYPWFFSNDQATTFNGLVGTIQPDIFYSSWQMLKEISNKANGNSGRIVHEISNNGSVYDKGRMEESQLHIIAAWNIYKWTGNKSFLKENYFYGKKIWSWLQQHDTDKNGYIEGYGGVEIEGLNEEMLDVQVYTANFLEVMSKMALEENDKASSVMFQLKAAALKEKINKDWWVPEANRYADFISTKEKAIAIIDTALKKRIHAGRNEWALKYLTDLKTRIRSNNYSNKGYIVYYNATGLLPVRAGIADTPVAMQAINNINWFTNKYGLYISGIERPDNLSIDEGNFKHDEEFNYNRAVMPAETSTIVESACRYKEIDTALKYMHVMLSSFSYATPGTMYEISPDYGMFVQAWNIVGLNIPLLQYFFGIDPLASHKEIYVRPAFPVKWNNASIKNVIIGNNLLSIQFKKNQQGSTYIIESSQPGWTVYFKADKPAFINGKKQNPVNNFLLLKDKYNVIKF